MFFNIKDKFEKSKLIENDIVLVLVIVFTALIAFGLGRLSAFSERKTPIIIEDLPVSVGVSTEPKPGFGSPEEKLFVASRNGSKYHYPWCPGAQSIKEENKIWFSTREEAEAAGYSPAANCKGL